MTLLRQLLIAILALMSVVLAGSLAISVVHTRDYLDAQLRSHAQDAATSLGLSLSTSAAEDDRATMEAMVDALRNGVNQGDVDPFAGLPGGGVITIDNASEFTGEWAG